MCSTRPETCPCSTSVPTRTSTTTPQRAPHRPRPSCPTRRRPGLFALTAVFQGLNARYYFRRIATIERYLSETPDWVLELQRSARVS